MVEVWVRIAQKKSDGKYYAVGEPVTLSAFSQSVEDSADITLNAGQYRVDFVVTGSAKKQNAKFKFTLDVVGANGTGHLVHSDKGVVVVKNDPSLVVGKGKQLLIIA